MEIWKLKEIAGRRHEKENDGFKKTVREKKKLKNEK